MDDRIGGKKEKKRDQRLKLVSEESTKSFVLFLFLSFAPFLEAVTGVDSREAAWLNLSRVQKEQKARRPGDLKAISEKQSQGLTFSVGGETRGRGASGVIFILFFRERSDHMGGGKHSIARKQYLTTYVYTVHPHLNVLSGLCDSGVL